MDGANYFGKIHYKATYWYLIEMIAVRLKTGERRNPKIYEFNPDVVYNQEKHQEFAFLTSVTPLN